MYNKLEKIYHLLQDTSLLSHVENISYLFFDEPKFYVYTALYNRSPQSKHHHDDMTSHGFSTKNALTALMKCLMEGVERFALSSHLPKNIVHSTEDRIKQKYVDLSFNKISHKDTSHISFGWVQGINLEDKVSTLLPAQLIYLNYPHKNEPILSTRISTGAAAGFSHEGTLLRGVYEIVERDCFMTMYLNKIPAPMIDLLAIPDLSLQATISEIAKYNLELYTFEITNDLEIPSYMTVLLDKTGIGPAVSVGLKSSFNILAAIMGSIEEACSVGRSLMRYNNLTQKIISKKKLPREVKTLLERAMYWGSVDAIKKLDFLIKQTSVKKNIYTKKITPKNELRLIIKSLSSKNHLSYYTDITPLLFKDVPLRVYKVLIPSLQPLYLDETKKEIRTERLNATAIYYGSKKNNINKIPHPFL